MRSSGGVSISIKVILFSGVLVFVLLMMVSSGLRSALKPNTQERVSVRALQAKNSPFKGTRAYEDVQALCALGPRSSGSEGAEQAREYIRAALAEAGLEVETLPFSAGGEAGVNLVGRVRGASERAILIAGHYDTFGLGEGVHVGANSAGSSTAILLELARVFGKERKGRTIILGFLDRHYAAGETDSEEAEQFLGAAALAEALGGVDAALSIEGLGDCYLRAGLDTGAPDWMREIFANTADRMRYKPHFNGPPEDLETPVDAFRMQGIPAAHLQDRSYGGSLVEHRKYWLTEQDTPDRVCPESLQAAGDVLYDGLRTIDKRLDYMAEP